MKLVLEVKFCEWTFVHGENEAGNVAILDTTVIGGSLGSP